MVQQDPPIQIRPETSHDAQAVYQLNLAAFERPNEARLVDRLRGQPGTISLVAEQDDQVVGHIFFCPVDMVGKHAAARICALAPMAVLPAFQGRGIGSQLVQAGLHACRSAGYQLSVVLGHPRFYPRFGFQPAPPQGIHFPTPVPDEVFMVIELVPGVLPSCSGTIQYPPEFRDVD